MTLEQLAYQYLTHGYDKNGIGQAEAQIRAIDVVNHMSNAEFLELISDQLEERLERFVIEQRNALK